MTMAHPERRGIILGLIAMLLFSVNDGIWKYALPATTMPVIFFMTFGISALGFGLWAAISKTSLCLVNRVHGFVYGLLFIFEQGFFLYALGHMPMVDVFVIVLTTPLFVLLGARVFLNEHLTPPQTLSVFSGFAGAALVIAAGTVGTDAVANQETVTLGLLCAVLNVLTGAVKILFLRKFCQGENVFAMNIWSALAFAVIAATAAERDLAALPPGMAGILAGGAVLSALGGVCYLRAFQIARAPLISATQYSQIAWAVLIGTIAFAEPVSSAAITGIIMITASGILLYGRFFKRAEV